MHPNPVVEMCAKVCEKEKVALELADKFGEFAVGNKACDNCAAAIRALPDKAGEAVAQHSCIVPTTNGLLDRIRDLICRMSIHLPREMQGEINDLLASQWICVNAAPAALPEGYVMVPEKDMNAQLGIPMHDTVHNAVHRVYFRAGLLACREYMARFVEAQDKGIAASIRANWWPDLGVDPGQPRLLDWSEVADESGEIIEHKNIDPSVEALPYAKQFLDAAAQGERKCMDAPCEAPATCEKEGKCLYAQY